MANDDQINKLYLKLNNLATKGGYYLNPEIDFTKSLIESLSINANRYGYESCPCRLASGDKKTDLDIICPCNYRDQDLLEFGTCYCGLYVNKEIYNGKQSLKPIPDRRETQDSKGETMTENLDNNDQKINAKKEMPIWRCPVCGYLCAKKDAPLVCPICGATHDRFERFQ